MSKRIIKLSVFNEAERNIMFKEGLLESLRNNSITAKNGKIYMETGEKVYCVDIRDFSFVWGPSFKYIFENNIPQIIKKENINENVIMSIYMWTNPIFDELPEHIDEKDKCLKDFKSRIASDEEYYRAIRAATLNQIESLSIEKRKDYIDRFISFGVLGEEDKIPLQYYAMYSPEILKKLFEYSDFSEKNKIEIVSQVYVQEREKQQKFSDKKGKKITNNRIVHLVNLLSIPEILDIFLSGILTNEELSKTRVTKKDLLNTPYEILLEILSDKNDLLPESLKITSRDLLNEYGRTRNGNEIFKLAKYGYIEPQDLIEVYEINKVLRNTGYDEPIFEDDKLRDYYTPELLVQMNRDNKISPKFIQGYLELFDFENNPELFRTRSQALVTELERRAEENSNIESDVLYFFDIGLCDTETAKLYISDEYIERKYLNNEISIEKVIEYYHLGLISDTAIANYYSDQEIIELYENGTLNGKCLRVISDTDLLMEEFIEGKISDEDFIMSYLNGHLSVIDLSDAIQISEKEIDISSFIDESVSSEKIKELFLNYLIDYASLLRFHNQGIIDDKEFRDIKESLNMQEFFQELNKGKKYKVVTSRKSPSSSKEHIEQKKDKEKDEDKFSEEILLISKLLSKDVESEPYSLIESYNSKGRATSLNNYRIFGNEDLDGIIILQKSKKENAVYLMSALQMMYFLNGKENDAGDIEIQNRMKDKAYLKTIEGVEVVEHTEYFARNLVEAASRISPKIAERVKASDREYISEVEKMVTDMRRTYRESKQRGRDEE